MKQKLFTLIAMLMCNIIANGMNDVYTVFNNSTGTLTYYYDDQFEPFNAYHELYDPVSDPEAPRFIGYSDKVVKCVIDKSMKNAPLTSMMLMFCGHYDQDTGQIHHLNNLKEIEGIENLNTSQVTNMSYMFADCSSLKSLDLSSFNTAKVKDMRGMFWHCSSLKSLNLSSFNTANVTNMYTMFYICSSLTSLDLSSFNTANVTDMEQMFYNCSALTSLDLSSFNTAKVKTMKYMFEECGSLTSLDLSSFTTNNVTNMCKMFYQCSSLTSLDLTNFDVPKCENTTNMFGYCQALKTIICVNDWSESSALKFSELTFHDCALVGGQGTQFTNYLPQNKTSARPDGGTASPGYFTATPKVYTEFDESKGVLTYYYDLKWISRKGVTELYDPINNPKAVRFRYYADKVVKGVIDESMKNANLTSLMGMFDGGSEITNLVNMQTLYGLEYLNTSNVTSMEDMFENCQSLISVDLTSFDITNLENVQYMFWYCYDLRTIYCNEDWSANDKITESKTMFFYCTSLVGGDGTEFDNTKTNKAYARPDGGTDSPGYFTVVSELYTNFDERSGTLTYHYDHLRTTRSGVTEFYDPVGNPYAVRFTDYYDQVKKAVIDPSMKKAGLSSTKGMFYGGINSETGTRQFLSAMTEIEGLENLNTENVFNMREMFYGCNALESLDLRTFSIAKVTNMISMFDNCKALTTIFCNDDWSGTTAESNKMFYSCRKLKGGQGTAYVYTTNDIIYARPDGGEESPGYFSIMGDADGDGKVTTADAEAIISNIMGNPPAGFNETLADVNRDGVINVADAVAVVNIIK